MKKIIFALFFIMSFAVTFTGCSGEKKKPIQKGRDMIKITTKEPEETTQEDENLSYDVKDLAVVLSVDLESSQIILKSLQNNEEYVLQYNGACDITDKYGDIIAMSQIEDGEIVDSYYINANAKLVKLHISEKAFEYKKVSKFHYSEEDKIFEMRDSKYSFDDSLVVTSDGADIELSEVSDIDELTVKGIDKKVCSIIVTKGHGYIKLDKTDHFVGGILELGREKMVLITDDMLVTAPEGTYKVTATVGGVGGTKEITVNRDEEIRLKLTDFQDEAKRYGSYSFEISVEGATLYVDGRKTDYTSLVELPYGSHEIKVVAEGYKTYKETILTDEVFETKTIDLEGEDSSSETNDDDDGSETISPEESADKKNQLIYIDAPADAQVYFDGTLKGVAPVSFDKVTGTHLITLRREGYGTKMYTIEVADNGDDIHFVLPDMVAGDG